jgi:tetratricopeptide (TPR) repeat protein
MYMSVIGVVLFPSFMIADLLSRHTTKWLKFGVILLASIIVSSMIFQSIHGVKTWQNSFSLWSKVIEKNPQHPKAYFNRGIAYKQKGYITESINDFTTVIQLEPNNPKAYFARGVSYGLIGDYQKAIQDYTTTLKLSPQNMKRITTEPMLMFISMSICLPFKTISLTFESIIIMSTPNFPSSYA